MLRGTNLSESQPEGTQVTVIIPAHQASGHIARALDSVFAQTYRNLEIVVVNDGSPDTEALEKAVHPYADRIRYVKQENRGPSGARNAGILAARGRYVAFLDSDDVWYPNHLASQMQMFLQDESLGLVYSDYLLLRNGVPAGHAFSYEPQAPEVSFTSLLAEDSSIGTSSVVVLRQAIIDAGMFDESLRRCEDFHLWLRLAHNKVKMKYQTGVTLAYAEGNGLAGDRYLMNRARWEVYQKILADLPLTAGEIRVTRALADRVQADCELDLARKFLREEQYQQALESTERAASLLHDNWKLQLAVVGMRQFPRLLRQCTRMRQWIGFHYRRWRGFKTQGIIPSPSAVARKALQRPGEAS